MRRQGRLRRPRDRTGIVGTELVTTSITSGGDGSAELGEEEKGYLRENPHVKLHNKQRGYVRTQFTADQLRADFRVVPYVSKPGAPVETLASFAVEDGKPGLHRL